MLYTRKYTVRLNIEMQQKYENHGAKMTVDCADFDV